MDILKIFRLSPSFFSFISGVFVSIATNLFTSILLTTGLNGVQYLYVSVVSMVVVTLCFLAIALALEEIREKARGGDLMPHIRTWRKFLVSFSAGGLVGFILAFVFIYIAAS